MATTHNAHHHDVGGFTAESEGRNLPAAQTQTFREVGSVLWYSLHDRGAGIHSTVQLPDPPGGRS
ncbi:hypothetical protein BZL33_24250 [Escherichia coli]|nr:hypothetical protein BZL33_24250 [Escherichia coli]